MKAKIKKQTSPLFWKRDRMPAAILQTVCLYKCPTEDCKVHWRGRFLWCITFSRCESKPPYLWTYYRRNQGADSIKSRHVQCAVYIDRYVDSDWYEFRLNYLNLLLQADSIKTEPNVFLIKLKPFKLFLSNLRWMLLTYGSRGSVNLIEWLRKLVKQQSFEAKSRFSQIMPFCAFFCSKSLSQNRTCSRRQHVNLYTF